MGTGHTGQVAQAGGHTGHPGLAQGRRGQAGATTAQYWGATLGRRQGCLAPECPLPGGVARAVVRGALRGGTGAHVWRNIQIIQIGKARQVMKSQWIPFDINPLPERE